MYVGKVLHPSGEVARVSDDSDDGDGSEESCAQVPRELTRYRVVRELSCFDRSINEQTRDINPISECFSGAVDSGFGSESETGSCQ